MRRHANDRDRNSTQSNPRVEFSSDRFDRYRERGGKQHPYLDRYEERFIDPFDRDLHPKTAGSHVGKGPKGYVRSDERIREDVCETITHHRGVDGSDLVVEVSGGVVTLAGTVRERRMKRAAEIAVESLPGVRDVENRIRVRRYDDYRTDPEIARREGRAQGPG
jgi:hypothetical protein